MSGRCLIIIPVDNKELYISNMIRSLLSQTYGDYDAIVSCNECTDKYFEIANIYSDIDKRVKLLKTPKHFTHRRASAACAEGAIDVGLWI